MKKILGMFLAVFMILGAAGNASAYFEYNHLTLAVYDSSVEVGVDLVATANALNGWSYDTTTAMLDGQQGKFQIAAAGTVDFSLFTDLTATNVGVYSANDAMAYTLTDEYYGTSRTGYGTYGDEGPGAGGFNDAVFFETSAYNISTYNYSTSGSAVSVGTPSETYSYWNVMDLSITEAKYAELNKSASGDQEPSLSDSAAAVLYLYRYDIASDYSAMNLNSGTGFTDNPYYAIIWVDSDGSVWMQTVAVPVPAAVWLLGSGLIGLIGIRRRMA